MIGWLGSSPSFSDCQLRPKNLTHLSALSYSDALQWSLGDVEDAVGYLPVVTLVQVVLDELGVGDVTYPDPHNWHSLELDSGFRSKEQVF